MCRQICKQNPFRKHKTLKHLLNLFLQFLLSKNIHKVNFIHFVSCPADFFTSLKILHKFDCTQKLNRFLISIILGVFFSFHLRFDYKLTHISVEFLQIFRSLRELLSKMVQVESRLEISLKIKSHAEPSYHVCVLLVLFPIKILNESN